MTIEYRYMRKAAPRADGKDTLEGRAWVYGSATQIGKGPAGFQETIRAGAGKKSVNDGDIVLLDNHQHHQPLARMSAGTLELRDGPNGGDWVATPADTSYAKDVIKNVRAGNYGGCSFGFEVIRDKWTDDEGRDASPLSGTKREILEMKVHEISICTFPAYGTTSVSARDQIRSARGGNDERAAAATYQDLYTCADCGAQQQYGSFCTGCGHSMAAGDTGGNGFCASCGAALTGEGRAEHKPGCEKRADSKNGKSANKKPYGDVEYADPGYQADGKKRYPLDSKKHIRAAWGYINQKDNADKYTASQLASIKSKIKAAMSRVGIKAEEQNGDEWLLLADFREMTEGQDSEGDLNDVSFGVGPGGYVRAEDANALAKLIKDACDAEQRVNVIDMAGNLGLAELLPNHWGPNGEIGSLANGEAVRDMADIYEHAINLPATPDSLAIINRSEPYLSELTREEANKPAEPDVDVDAFTEEEIRRVYEEAKRRYRELS
jgi:HK97 family phage prohead protease